MLSDSCKQLIPDFSSQMKLHHYFDRKKRSSFFELEERKFKTVMDESFIFILNKKRVN